MGDERGIEFWNVLIVCDPNKTEKEEVYSQYMWLIFRGHSPVMLLDRNDAEYICRVAEQMAWTIMPMDLSTERAVTLFNIAKGSWGCGHRTINANPGTKNWSLIPVD